MITSVRGFQSSGKGLSIVAADLDHLNFDGYVPDEVYVNYLLKIPGVHILDNKGMINFLTDMVKKGYEHKLVNITEADRVFPARFWQQNEQTNALIGLWQDEKLFNIVYYDAHAGTGVDVTLRSVRQIAWLPQFDKLANTLDVHVINGVTGDEYDMETIEGVSEKLFPYYDRWWKVR
jgi:hypothetical protein